MKQEQLLAEEMELAPLSSSLARNSSRLEKVNKKISEMIADSLREKERLEKRDAAIREQIEIAMRNRVEAGMDKKYEDDVIAVTYIAPTRRAGIDTKKLKEEKPDIYKKYEKFSKIKEQVRIKVKE